MFTKEKLDKRFFYFKNICFRSLISQSRNEFKVIILVDKNLPDDHHIELQKLIQDYPNFIIHVWNTSDDIKKNDWVMPYINTDLKNIIYTRIDDDDGIHVDIMKSINNAYNKWKKYNMIPTFYGCKRGNYLVDKGENYNIIPTRNSFIAIGLSYFTKITDDRTIFYYDHSKLSPSFGIRLMDNNKYKNAYICTAHKNNNSLRYINLAKKCKDNNSTELSAIYKLMEWKELV